VLRIPSANIIIARLVIIIIGILAIIVNFEVFYHDIHLYVFVLLGATRVIIIMPLRALTIQQIKKLNAIYVSEQTHVKTASMSSSNTHFVISPETMLSCGIDMLSELSLKNRQRFSHTCR